MSTILVCLAIWYLVGFVSLILGAYIAQDKELSALDILFWSTCGLVTLAAVVQALRHSIQELESKI